LRRAIGSKRGEIIGRQSCVCSDWSGIYFFSGLFGCMYGVYTSPGSKILAQAQDTASCCDPSTPFRALGSTRDQAGTQRRAARRGSIQRPNAKKPPPLLAKRRGQRSGRRDLTQKRPSLLRKKEGGPEAQKRLEDFSSLFPPGEGREPGGATPISLRECAKKVPPLPTRGIEGGYIRTIPLSPIKGRERTTKRAPLFPPGEERADTHTPAETF
jgi:hypothetical protein